MSYSTLGKKVAKASSHSRKKDPKGVDSTIRAVEGIIHRGIDWHSVLDTIELENIHHYPAVLSGVRGRKICRIWTFYKMTSLDSKNVSILEKKSSCSKLWKMKFLASTGKQRQADL